MRVKEGGAWTYETGDERCLRGGGFFFVQSSVGYKTRREEETDLSDTLFSQEDELELLELEREREV